MVETHHTLWSLMRVTRSDAITSLVLTWTRSSCEDLVASEAVSPEPGTSLVSSILNSLVSVLNIQVLKRKKRCVD